MFLTQAAANTIVRMCAKFLRSAYAQSMPAKPLWYGRLPQAIAELRSLPWPWVDRSALEQALGVGRRRAQQILAPLAERHIGANGVADRERLIAHLEALAEGEQAHYEQRRRQLFAEKVQSWQQSRRLEPTILVEAPASLVNQAISSLPEGVTLRPGEIVVHFSTAVEALEKLLAIAMAAGNDLDSFERLVT